MAKGKAYGMGERVALATHDDGGEVVPTPCPEGIPGRSLPTHILGGITPWKKGRALSVLLQSGGLSPSQIMAKAKAKKGG